jgi:hypothetical protein
LTSLSCVAAIFLSASASAAVVDYPSAVQALAPNHYYRLDETAMGAVSDIGSSPLPAAHEGLFPPAQAGVDGPLDLPGLTPGNRALFDNNTGGVRIGPGSSFASDTMSVAMWFLAPGGVGIGDRLFINNIERLAGGTQDSFQITLPNSASAWGIVFTTGQEADMQLALPTGVFSVQDNQWHHLVVARNGDDVNLLTVVVDGVDYSDVLTPTDVTWGTTGDNAHLGVRADDGGSDHNHNGSIDEVAIWLGRALTVQEAQGLYEAAFVPEPGTAALVLLGAAALLRARRVGSRG